jgi:DNA-dependent protein kinase catalytic subunit
VINTKAYLLKETILKKLINLTLVDVREQKPGE